MLQCLCAGCGVAVWVVFKVGCVTNDVHMGHYVVGLVPISKNVQSAHTSVFDFITDHILIGVGLHDRGAGFNTRSAQEIFVSLESVQTGCGVPSASDPTRSGVKVARA